MPDYKLVISLFLLVLVFVSYVPYIIDVIKNKTTPHSFTWLVWFLASGITAALQYSDGAGYGSYIAFTVSILSFIIFILAIMKKNKDITLIDFFFLFLSLVALYLWLVVKQPVWSIILIVGVDLLGFIPTVRKSWDSPFSETLFTFKLNAVRSGLNIFALQRYSIITWLSPVVWLFANFLFVILLIIRRKALSKVKI